MSEQTIDSEALESEPIFTKLYSQINEEKLHKDLASVQLSRIKSMDELALEIKQSEKIDDIRAILDENLQDASDSIVSRYLIGIIYGEKGSIEGMIFLRSLLDDFRKNAKWTVVDHIADRMLEIEPENRIALRAKVDSTERLKGKKELKPYLEKLASIDRKNPDIVKKYALSILNEDKEKALTYFKQAGETYARIKDYKNLEEIWNLVVLHDYEDIPFFERFERILVGNREKTRAAAYFQLLLEPFRIAEDWNTVIIVLKKILQYETASSRARSDLVRAYRNKYSGHSLLDDFIKMSEITNNKKPVGPCIASFERNIVFDKDNYVYHRTRGVGKITEIDQDQVIIDFRDNPNQRMSIKMAISSLKPLEPQHIWVRHYENPDDVTEIFQEDIPLFFEILLSSFEYKMTLSEIKGEISDKFISLDEWSKWWSRARTQLKKDPKFGFNPRKRDELHLRETPMTLSEELSVKFQSHTDWNKKLELAMETLKDPDTEGAAELCVQFYNEQEASKDLLKKMHSYFFLAAAASVIGEEYVPRKIKKSEIEEIFRNETPSVLIEFCRETVVVDLKREIINTIIATREDYPEILKEILFELPIKVNRYVVSELNRLNRFDTLTDFVNRAFSKFRENPEIFLWTARSILTGQWTYEWLKNTREEIILLVFRLLKPLARFEKKGTRLKNLAIETLFGTTNITSTSVKKGVMQDVVKDAEISTIRRISALFREVPYIPEAHKENFINFIHEMRPDFILEADIEEEEDIPEEIIEEAEPLIPDDNVVLVSQDGLNKRKDYLYKLINVEMPANSKEIGEAQEKGDLRENAEYKAALERQSQLQAEISLIDSELKKASLLHPEDVRVDVVSIGSKVELGDKDGNAVQYTILGPWEADADNHIISYLSPLGRSLIGKKPGESATIEGVKVFEVREIASAL